MYWFHLIGLIPYFAIIIVAIIYRYNSIDATGRCYIGLRREGSFPLLIYDIVINVAKNLGQADVDLSLESISLSATWVILVSNRAKPAHPTGCKENIK